jgi:hypothetical protein
MIRQLTLSLVAFGLMIAAADAAQMPVPAAPAKPGVAVSTAHVMTGRSAWHRHYYRHWHPHYHHHR